MYSGSYTEKGVKGLLKEGGTSRRDETIRMVESLGTSNNEAQFITRNGLKRFPPTKVEYRIASKRRLSLLSDRGICATKKSFTDLEVDFSASSKRFNLNLSVFL